MQRTFRPREEDAGEQKWMLRLVTDLWMGFLLWRRVLEEEDVESAAGKG